MGWKRKIATWGNSLAIRLPSQVFRKTTFKEGDQVDCEIVDENTIVIHKTDAAKDGEEGTLNRQ